MTELMDLSRPKKNGLDENSKNIFYHNPFVHSFFLCGLDIVLRHKMAVFDNNTFVYSFFLCGLDLVF